MATAFPWLTWELDLRFALDSLIWLFEGQLLFSELTSGPSCLLPPASVQSQLLPRRHPPFLALNEAAHSFCGEGWPPLNLER